MCVCYCKLLPNKELINSTTHLKLFNYLFGAASPATIDDVHYTDSQCNKINHFLDIVGVGFVFRGKLKGMCVFKIERKMDLVQNLIYA